MDLCQVDIAYVVCAVVVPYLSSGPTGVLLAYWISKIDEECSRFTSRGIRF